jgi:GTP-binding protein Era
MIILGKKGRSVKKLGELARRKIEHFIEKRIYLDLWVKVLPNWRSKKRDLERLGFHLPKPDRK